MKKYKYQKYQKFNMINKILNYLKIQINYKLLKTENHIYQMFTDY